MKYKAIILDLDGTTIPSKPDGRASNRVLQAINQAKKIVSICVSTSRPLFFAQPVLDQIDPNGPSTVNDATQLYDGTKRKIIKSLYLEHRDIPKILTILKKHFSSIMVNDGIGEYFFKDKLPKHVCSLCVPDIRGDIADKVIEELMQIPTIAVQKPFSHKKGLFWVSVTNALATKLHGVLWIAEYLHMLPEEIIGVGDGYNDYPLLSACGFKVAMENAVDEVKAIADYIAPSVEEDGVADVIEKFILH